MTWVGRFLVVTAAFILGGCKLLGARGEVEEIHRSAVLTGVVTHAADPASPVIVAAFRVTPGGSRLVHYVVLHEAGSYELLVPSGAYRVVAFADTNRNLRFDEGEAAGLFAPPEGGLVQAGEGGVLPTLDVSLARGRVPEGLPLGSSFPSKPLAPYHSTLAGALADLDEPVYSAAYAADTGYWRGVEFFRTAGGNIYFLEPYDPDRIPVLFVHGARGSPQDWRHAFERLDRTRYQAWFFYYPTSASMHSMSNLLNKKLWDLQARYRFPRMHIVAHSAGGLVARDFLVSYGDYHRYIDAFVTISTPWGGESAAELGVRHSPVVIPSWTDMQPQGSFIRALFARKLPRHVSHFLLFGFHGGLTLLRPNNDGAVTLASQLDPRAQSEAVGSYGFDDDHNGILDNPRILTQIQGFFSLAEARGGAAGFGELLIQSEGMSDEAVSRSQSLLILEDAKGFRQFLPLRPGSGVSPVMTLPADTYRAWLMSPGAVSTPAEQTVRVVAGERARLDLDLRPRGSLCGYVHTPQHTHAGLPDVIQHGRVRELTLKGPGVLRSTPPVIEDANGYRMDRDAQVAGQFCFVDLPSGDYRLTLALEGEMTRVIDQRVVAGEPGPPLAVRSSR